MSIALADIDRETSALLVVDMQPDFMPGGALPVAEGDVIIEPIRDLLLSDRFGLSIATQDWHPPGHISFASAHAGHAPFDRIQLYGHEQILWPDHCVQGTRGAELHGALPWQKMSTLIRKAADPLVDSYSAFRNNWDPRGQRPPTGLAGLLRERGIADVYICGLARDFCCKWSAEDAATAGFHVHMFWDLTRAVDPTSDSMVLQDLRSAATNVIRASG